MTVKTRYENHLLWLQKMASVVMRALACLFFCILFLTVTVTFSSSSINVNAQSSAQTTVNLAVLPTTQLDNPLLTLERIGDTEGLLFTLGPVQLIDGTIVPNAEVTLHIQPDGRSDYIILRGITDSEGKLYFDSSRPLSQQGLVIEGGDSAILSLINAYNDVVDAFAIAYLGDQESQSNQVTYAAADIPITEPPRTGGNSGLFAVLTVGVFVTSFILLEFFTNKRKIKRKEV